MDQREFTSIAADFQRYYEHRKPLGIVLFGSKADNTDNSFSDTDICIILEEINNLQQEIETVWEYVGGKYDVWIFEELKIPVQIEIIENHRVILCEDYPRLTEYFYKFRKEASWYKYRLKKVM